MIGRHGAAARETWIATPILAPVVAALERAGFAARRGLGQARAANEVSDVAIDAGPGGLKLWPEVKRSKRGNPRAALAQAQAACKPEHVPFALIWDDRKDPFVTLTLEDFLELAYGYTHYDRGAACGPDPRSPREEWIRGPKKSPG